MWKKCGAAMRCIVVPLLGGDAEVGDAKVQKLQLATWSTAHWVGGRLASWREESVQVGGAEVVEGGCGGGAGERGGDELCGGSVGKEAVFAADAKLLLGWELRLQADKSGDAGFQNALELLLAKVAGSAVVAR